VNSRPPALPPSSSGDEYVENNPIMVGLDFIGYVLLGAIALATILVWVPLLLLGLFIKYCRGDFK